MRISDWSSDVCSSDLFDFARALDAKCDHAYHVKREQFDQVLFEHARENGVDAREQVKVERVEFGADGRPALVHAQGADGNALAFRPRYVRSEEHTSELQSLMRISYAVF